MTISVTVEDSIWLWLIYIPLILINLTPFYPPLLRKERGKSFREEAEPPLLFSLPLPLLK